MIRGILYKMAVPVHISQGLEKIGLFIQGVQVSLGRVTEQHKKLGAVERVQNHLTQLDLTFLRAQKS